jgi:hypothetical protein
MSQPFKITAYKADKLLIDLIGKHWGVICTVNFYSSKYFVSHFHSFLGLAGILHELQAVPRELLKSKRFLRGPKISMERKNICQTKKKNL